MSQHDLVIDNATYPSIRSDINGALQALGSTSKGNARPATPYAGQQWIDDNTPSGTLWSWYLWTGSADIKVGELNTTTNLYTPFINGVSILASPTFTGTPAAPTAAPGTNTTQLATTAFVATSFAPLASPTFTGTPAAPTASPGTNTTQVATTAFVAAAVGGAGKLVNYSSTAVTAFTAATGITPIPLDNTIPTNTEGYEWGTLSYTPSSASNRLVIKATLFAGETSNVGDGLAQSILKDSDTSALSANVSNVLYGVGAAGVIVTDHSMTAGTTSAITFRARASGTFGDTNLSINGVSGARLFGGVAQSKIEVWEFTP